jgi:hypothetical protein
MAPIEDLPGRKTEKEVATLSIPGWAKRQCPHGSWGHRVVVLFVRLHIRAKLELAVFLVVKALAQDNFPRAQGIRDWRTSRKTVQPEHSRIHHLNHQADRHPIKRQRVVNRPRALLDGPDLPLNLPDVFIP